MNDRLLLSACVSGVITDSDRVRLADKLQRALQAAAREVEPSLTISPVVIEDDIFGPAFEEKLTDEHEIPFSFAGWIPPD